MTITKSLPLASLTIGSLRKLWEGFVPCLGTHLIGIVSAVVVAVAEELVVDALAVGAVVGAAGAGRDDAHEGHERLAGRQLPLLVVRGLSLKVGLKDGANAVAVGHVRLRHGPVTEVLRDLEEKHE